MRLNDAQKEEAAEWYNLLAPLRDEPGNNLFRPGMTPRRLAEEIKRPRSTVARRLKQWQRGRLKAGILVAPPRSKAGLASNLPGPKRGSFRSIPDPAEVLYIENLYLDAASRTGRTKGLTGLVLDELHARERESGIKAASWHAVDRVGKGMDRSLLIGAAEGMKGLTNRVLPQLVSTRPAGPGLLVTLDQWVCDWFVVGPDGKLVRPVLILVIDSYDGCIVGMAIGLELNSYLVIEAMIDAIRKKPDGDPLLQGRPELARTDMGKENLSIPFKDGLGLIGSKLDRTTPGHPQAKALHEATNKILATKLAPRFPYYAPPDIKTKPIRREPALSFSEAASRVRLFCLHEVNNWRVRKGGPTRLERRRASNFMPEEIPEEQLRVAFMRKRVVTVTPLGVKVDRIVYQEDRLFSLAGQQVTVLEDYRDLAHVQVHHEGKFFCIATNPLAADAQYDDAKRRQFTRDRRRLGRAIMDTVDERLQTAGNRERYLEREAEQLAAQAKGRKPGKTVRALVNVDPRAAKAMRQAGPTGPPVGRWPSLAKKYRR